MAADKWKKIAVPLAIIVICAAVIVLVLVLVLPKNEEGGRMHVVTDNSQQQIVRGELQISLVRERLRTCTLNQKGLPVSDTFDKTVDFSGKSDNIFGIDRDILVAPGCYFEADIAISNKKPYAFEYLLEIVPDDADSLLAGQQELTVTMDGETVVKQTLAGGVKTQVFPVVQSGQTARLTVRLEYLDTTDNDQTKNSTLAFDMIVHAGLATS